MCRACGVNDIAVVDPANLEETKTALKNALNNDTVSVVITRRPCALLKSVPKLPPMYTSEKCIGCKKCMGLGCPAISMKDGKAVIDQTLCVGCELCAGLCPVLAIESTAKEGK